MVRPTHLPEDPLRAGDCRKLGRVGERGHLRVRDRVVRDPEAARRDGAPGRRRAREDTGIWEVRRGNVPRLQDVCDAPTVGRVVPVVDRERDVRSGPRPVVDDAATVASADGGINVLSSKMASVATRTRDRRSEWTQRPISNLSTTLAACLDAAVEPKLPFGGRSRPTGMASGDVACVEALDGDGHPGRVGFRICRVRAPGWPKVSASA